MAKSKIEWTDRVWNPVTGCTPISEGCDNCYAERMSKRLAGRCGYPKDDPFKVTLHPDRLDQPARWKKPSKVFVCSMGDLLHENLLFQFIKKVWDVTVKCPQHTFIFLTKRPERMLRFAQWMAGTDHISIAEWPRNCWIGVTAENQQRADERIPILLQIPAAVRFVSVEPLLSAIDISQYLQNGVIANERKRNPFHGTCGDGAVFCGRTGQDMEASRDGRVRERTIIRQNAGRTNEGREKHGCLSSCPVQLQQKEIQGLCTPYCLDDNQQSVYSGQDGDKPQGREQNEPASGQSGIGNEGGEYNSQLQIPEKKKEISTRHEKCECQIDRHSGRRDKSLMQESTNVSRGDSKALSGFTADSFQHPSQQDMETYLGISWVICGGESGPGARPMHPDWARSLRDQCQAAGVPFMFKQWGEWYPDTKGLYLNENGVAATGVIFGDTFIHRVGKKRAGRLLDGRIWDEFPKIH